MMDMDEEQPIPLIKENREIIGNTQVDPKVSKDVQEQPTRDMVAMQMNNPQMKRGEAVMTMIMLGMMRRKWVKARIMKTKSHHCGRRY